MSKIVVIDERKAGMRNDRSNVDHPDSNAVRATIDEAEVVVRISQDTVWVYKGVGEVALFTVLSEPEESLAKARVDYERRMGGRTPIMPGGDEAVNRMDGAFSGPSNSGTEEVKGF